MQKMPNFDQLRQFEFSAKTKMGILPPPKSWLAPKSSQVGLRLSANPVGIINDPVLKPKKKKNLEKLFVQKKSI